MEAFASSVNYQNAEVETHVAVNPTNDEQRGGVLAAGPLERRGSHGNLAGYSFDGGRDLGAQRPGVHALRRRHRQHRRLRARDGSVAVVQPERPAARDHDRVRQFDRPQCDPGRVLDNGGATWSTPRIVRFDNPRAVGNAFNDKETLTADPFNSSLVYATWQRIISPSETTSQQGYNNASELLLGGVLRALHERRAVLGAGAGDLLASTAC